MLVRRSAYYDSITLMLASQDAERVPGVERVFALQATPLNRELVEAQGFALHADLGPNDLLIAISAGSADAADAAVEAVDRCLAGRGSEGRSRERPAAKSVTAAARSNAGLNFAFVSVPGTSATYECARALEEGMHVFCFSSGMSLEDEAHLKGWALERGLLFMGADCGTVIVDGVAFGFANALEQGPVGIVGASGTGIQEVTCLLDLAGVGISHAIGVGGRDLSSQIGGAMTARALELLARDPGTKVVVAISKPPAPTVAERVAEAAAATGKPVVLAFLGASGEMVPPEGVQFATSLEEAARRAAALAGGQLPELEPSAPPAVTRGFVRGLFCGGSLCYEAMAIASRSLGEVTSNIPLREEWRVAGANESRAHTFIDFGDDEFTQGRPHPMIDSTLRNERLVRESHATDVGVILLDVILGHGAHPDPAGAVAPAIEAARTDRPELLVIASLCGTAGDPQDLYGQSARLEKAGAVVVRASAQAARLAVAAVEGASR